MKKIFGILFLLTISLLVVSCTPDETQKVNFTLEVTEGGEVTGGNSGEYEVATEINLVATADEGYEFEGWFEGNNLKSDSLEYSIVLEKSITLTAKFKLIEDEVVSYDFSVSAIEGGEISGTKSGTYNENTVISVTATPDEGYLFKGWYTGETLVSDSLTYVFDLVKDLTLVANFEKEDLDKLDAPSNIQYDPITHTLTWSEVNGANGYRISGVALVNNEASFPEVVVTTNEFDVSNLQSRNHTISIISVGVLNESADSLPATYDLEIEPAKLSEVTNINYDSNDDTLSWDEVPNSDGYLVEIYQENEMVLSSDGDIATSLSISSLGSGTYSAEITTYAQINSVYYVDSDVEIYNFEIESLGVLNNPSNLHIEDGYLLWDQTTAVKTVIKLYEFGSSLELDNYNVSFDGPNKLFLTDLGVESGNYTVGVQFESNRHDNKVTAEITFDISLEIVESFDAETIATFSGDIINGGEHASVSLVTVDGIDYARVIPTADGWGRVASPNITMNFSKNPIVFLKIGTVIGGYHMQLSKSGSIYTILDDTATQGSTNINLVKGNEASLVGVGEGFLRLGVNQRTGAGMSEVSVDYQSVVVAYVSEYIEIEEVTELDKVKNLDLNFLGYITWSNVNNADGYYVTITKDGEVDPVVDRELITSSQYEARLLREGIYTINVIAYNSEFEIESEEVSDDYKIEITTVKTYNANDIAGFSGDNITSALDPENSNLAILNSGKATTYGWSFPSVGIDLNMDKNPFIITEVNKVSGGYFYHGGFTGNTHFPYKNDTPGDILNPTTWVYRANVNVDRQTVDTQDFNGLVNNYLIKPGVWHPGGSNYSQVWLESIRIIYIEEWEEVVIPVEVEESPTPSGFKLEKGVFSWGSVSLPSGSPDPKYQITITNTLNPEDTFFIPSQLGRNVSLSNYNLTSNATYDIEVVVLGDASGDDEKDLWYKDSNPGLATFEYIEVLNITDFENLTDLTKKGGDFEPVSSLGDNNSLIIKAEENGWNIFSFLEIPESELNGEIINGKSLLIMQLGEVVGTPTMHFGYYSVGAGDNYQRIWGDTSISSHQKIVSGDWIIPSMVYDDSYLQFYSGFGGGDKGRSFEIIQIMIATYKLK